MAGSARAGRLYAELTDRINHAVVAESHTDGGL
jgi:hypothetical protein